MSLVLAGVLALVRWALLRNHRYRWNTLVTRLAIIFAIGGAVTLVVSLVSAPAAREYEARLLRAGLPSGVAGCWSFEYEGTLPSELILDAVPDLRRDGEGTSWRQVRRVHPLDSDPSEEKYVQLAWAADSLKPRIRVLGGTTYVLKLPPSGLEADTLYGHASTHRDHGQGFPLWGEARAVRIACE